MIHLQRVDLSTYAEVWRVRVADDQMVEYIVRRQDPAVAGPDARTLVTKIEMKAGDIFLVLRPPRHEAVEAPF